MVVQIRRVLLSALFIVLGIISAGFGLKSFLLPNHFIDGGVTGISMLLSMILGLPLPVLLLLVNLPFIGIGYFQIGRGFAATASLSIIGLALCLHYVEFPIVTHDKLLCSVFGGMFLGAGIGLAIRGHSVLDGTEIFALLVSKKTAFTVGDVITLLNVVIFSAGAFVLGIELALYSILTYLSASRAVDFLLNRIEEYNGVVIVSPKSMEIKQRILHRLDRGVTVYKGSGGYSGEDINILYCVVTKLEVYTIKEIVRQIDESAFLVFQSINDASGGLTTRRGMH